MQGARWGADVQKGETKPNPTKKKKAKSEKLLSVGRNAYSKGINHKKNQKKNPAYSPDGPYPFEIRGRSLPPKLPAPG